MSDDKQKEMLSGYEQLKRKNCRRLVGASGLVLASRWPARYIPARIKNRPPKPLPRRLPSKMWPRRRKNRKWRFGNRILPVRRGRFLPLKRLRPPGKAPMPHPLMPKRRLLPI